eukprot:1314627-Amphidinium_carterae.1
MATTDSTNMKFIHWGMLDLWFVGCDDLERKLVTSWFQGQKGLSLQRRCTSCERVADPVLANFARR